MNEPASQQLNELISEANANIDTILAEQTDPKQAATLANEIKEIAREFFAGCLKRYYALVRAEEDQCQE